MENPKAGRKGNLNVATEVFQVAPSLHVVELKKAKGDTLEFQNVLVFEILSVDPSSCNHRFSIQTSHLSFAVLQNSVHGAEGRRLGMR
jgi:hypothetical protein